MKKAGRFFFLISAAAGGLLCPAAPALTASAADCTALAVQSEENGILIPEDGQEWYKVNALEDNTDYILTVRTAPDEQLMLVLDTGITSRYVWNYYKTTMTPSTDPRISTLSAGGYRLSNCGGVLGTDYPDWDGGDSIWEYEPGVLSYFGNGKRSYLKYDAGSDEPFRFTEEKADASEVLLYARGVTLSRCITKQPCAGSYVTEGSGYPAPVFSVGLSDVTADSIRWYVDGDEQSCTEPVFSADILTDRPAGVHRVSCLVTAHDSSCFYYRERSAEAAFIICKGVLPDSVMTFSDIHEEYELIGRAIAAIMQKTGGLIPSLVICSGDFVNGPTAEKDAELGRFFPQIVSHLGGLDAVFVSGNHDSAEAAALMSASAGLGAAQTLPAAGGVIFRGESEGARSGRNGRFARGIIAYGINFAAAEQKTDGEIRYSYENIIGDTERFLSETAAQYHGELVIISAHSGLHVLGMQPQSVNRGQWQLREWLGDNIYNVDQSYGLAQTINRYAEQYDMDIMYLFGHNHSRGEAELFLTDGDTLFSTEHYDDRSAGSLTLRFTYANAGYLSTVIGSADENFTFLYRDGDKFVSELLSVRGETVRHSEIAAKHPYEEPVPAETTEAAGTTVQMPDTETTAAQTAVQTAASGQNGVPAPDAGESGNPAAAAVSALAVLVLCRRRRNRTAAR